MKTQTSSLALTIIGCLLFDAGAIAKEQKPPTPTGWGYAAKGSVDVRPKPSERKKPTLRLGRGGLVPIFELKQAAGRTWARVVAVDTASLTPQGGWIDASQIETLPIGQYPMDAELLKLLGGPYLDDFTAAHTAIARFLVRQGERESALVCFLGSPILPQARFQVFLPSRGKFTLGPYLEFPFADLKAAITSLEIRDLVGDGNECLVTRETFNLGPENEGVSLVIRRLEAGGLKTLWKAPVEFTNLASFPPKIQVLAPPEKNIGGAGTVTKGSVDFRPRGRASDLVWKGKVEFHVFGREQPVETIAVEKVCAWDGTKFAPLF